VLASRGRVKRSVPLDPSEDLGVVGEPVRVRTVVRRARRGSATSSGTGMPGSPTANGAPLDLDAHAVPGLLARSDEIKVSCACVRIPRSRCYGAAGRNADILGRE
jgi:hypothetical protein